MNPMESALLPQARQKTSPGVVGCPLLVRLEGALLKSDLLVEGYMALLRSNPLLLFAALGWRCRGRLFFVEQIARRSDLDVAHLPYQAAFLDYLRAEADAGRKIHLLAGTGEVLARQIAEYLGIFQSIFLCHSLGKEGPLPDFLHSCGPFDYAGNTPTDLALCSRARQVIPVNAGRRFLRGLQPAVCPQSFDDRPGRLLVYLRAMRWHQWLKNLLIFLSLFTTLQWHLPAQVAAVIVAFFAFSLSASAIYLLNDLIDLPADRRHPHKCQRPFAAGEIPLRHGIMMILLLVAGSLALATRLPGSFMGVLLVYLAVTTLYSFYLKKVMLVDVVTLAGLYTLRVVAGAAAIRVVPSFWLLSFSMCIFLSLALVKRYAELRALAKTRLTSARGRDYNRSDSYLLSSMGTASGFLSILVFALFIDSPEVARDYAHPEWLWLICPVLLYWIGRVWIKAGTGRDE